MAIPDVTFKHPALVYVDSRDAIHQVDGDVWDPANLSGRDRVLCIALLKHALDRLEAARP